MKRKKVMHVVCRARWAVPLLLVMTTGTLLSGCGGGGGNGDSKDSPLPQATPTPAGQVPGSARLIVQWPSRTGRLIPLASESIVVVFQDAAHKELARATPVRANDDASATEVRFTGVPVGDYFVSATAYPNADGSGTVQAQATVPVTIASGAETTLSLSLNSTIAHLVVETPGNNPPTVSVGQTFALSAVARDANGAVVLTHAGQFTWQTSNGNIATVDANGVVTGLAAGQATISVRDTESGNAAQVVVVIALLTL